MLLLVAMFAPATYAHETERKSEKKKKEVQYNENGEIIKTGYNYGPLPAVAFDADKGFQLGALLNIYDLATARHILTLASTGTSRHRSSPRARSSS